MKEPENTQAEVPPPKRPRAGFADPSMPEDGLVETRRRFEVELDDVARVGRERDSEPKDEPDVIVEPLEWPSTTKVGFIRRPLRRFLKLRKDGASASDAAIAVSGCIPTTHDDPTITRARARFSALTLGVHFLNEEARAAAVLEEWAAAMRRTHAMRATIGLWKSDLTKIEETIDGLIRKSDGLLETLLPQLPSAIAHFDVAAELDILERALGLAAARLSPDIMNLVRGTGGQHSRYSLGRILFSLVNGRVHGSEGVHWSPAYSASERHDLVCDDTGADAENGRVKRYDTALARYVELHCELFPESPIGSYGIVRPS